MLSKGSTKTRMVSEPVSIVGLSESGGNAKSQENPASTLLLSSGNAGSCCMWMVSVLLRWVIIFFTNLQNPFRFPGAGEWEEKIRSLYRDSWRPFCQSCIPAGIFAIYMTDGTENSSMEFPDFLLHTFILHKHPFFTTFLKNFTLMCR